MMMNKKGQAALEFLMTYGWAILVVLIAIGALAYFGVLSPSNLLPSKCTLQPGMVCADQKITPGQVTVVLKNGYGADITIHNVTLTSCGNYASYGILKNGVQASFVVNCNGSQPLQGSRYNGVLNVSYTNEDTELQRNNIGDLVGKVE
ncbi:TPA: hypothetical protein HA281_01555 [Candidatus Woesearchaeota archaeon]|nr:hypothetical protein [Candidatus Woesearchaeota archaeon]HIH91465.1 hypothetical protein [Candidatus Woesearchaeota archaeon]HIJ18067.1 hypothetical protein [Candidatus Woesearchaeota archaeon]